MYKSIYGYHTPKFITILAKWIENFPKDNYPTFKITDKGVKVRFSDGHYKCYTFDKILKDVGKY